MTQLANRTHPLVSPRVQVIHDDVERDSSFSARVILFILFHIPLAFLIRWDPIFSTAHALLTVGIGFVWLLQDRQPYRLIYLAAYITGAELIWRGTGANIFWETGKYATSLLLILAMFKYRLLPETVKWPAVYFALLIPSVFLLPRFDREAIAFNLAGPFALAVCTMFFSTIKLTRVHMRRILVALVAPAVGLAVLATYGTFAAQTVVFTGASIKTTAAGIGPNQVSSILGLGTLAAFFYILTEPQHRVLRVVMIGLLVWMLAQAALTFSRGGVWTTIGAIAVGAFYLFRDRRARSVFVLSTALILFVGYFVVFPLLNNFTGGLLAARFRSFETTGRDKIIQVDLKTFKQHPVLGVGPHQSKIYHLIELRAPKSTHTEYSRLLAEHGSFGLLALLILLWNTAHRVMARRPPVVKAYMISFTAWALLFMYHSATRLVAPSFMFGLAAATFAISNQCQKDVQSKVETDASILRAG